ncbi:glycosyltransferase [Roseomonas fluvialis]|uniref:Uncharacterized protein n=1 Tax=Roseomonas fluvialis TaxID=1750527 RepID=A0ABM7Y692_9PROT|nr:glycosyltransferase [Roseomonas fluvialis]BDG73475.1 hypothetical protein Rmf_34040 [Roseomonas fluvialis]
MISTISVPTPPQGYGGIERVVHALAEELVRQGHEVTLFARAGSACSGQTIEVDPAADQPAFTGGKAPLNEQPLCDAVEAYTARHRLDVLHDWSLQNIFVNRHPDRVPFVVSTCVPQPEGYAQANVVAACAAHARTLKGGTVPHVGYGVDVQSLDWSEQGGERQVHLAKIARYKGQHVSILAAALSRQPLDIVGNIEGRRYAKFIIEPMAALLPNVRLLGETREVERMLAASRALVLAPLWFEVYPMVVIQALCAGTPVVTLRSGGLPEQVEDGVNGYLADNVMGLARAMREVRGISRKRCREVALERFAVRDMATRYAMLYRRSIDGERW